MGIYGIHTYIIFLDVLRCPVNGKLLQMYQQVIEEFTVRVREIRKSQQYNKLHSYNM